MTEHVARLPFSARWETMRIEMAAEYPPLPAAHRPVQTGRCRLRHSVELLVCLLLASMVTRTWLVEGLFVPFLVSGGSMADTLVGRHREVVCSDCGHRFDCDAEVRPRSPRAVCPNCGYAANDLAARPDVAGDRLLVWKAAHLIRPPRRWEVIAFHHPHHASRRIVKRVVGLPNESVRILGGDVYSDGQIQRKGLAQQRALAVVVYDAGFPPTLDPSLPPRWKGDRSDTRWKSTGGLFTRPATPNEKSIDWLVYRHWRRVPGGKGRVREMPIIDVRGYDQSRPRRVEDVHSVRDLLMSFRLRTTVGRGLLLVETTDGREEFRVVIDPRGQRFEVFRQRQPIGAGGRGKLPPTIDGLHVEISLLDRQFLLAFDGRPAVVHPYELSDRPLRPTSRPVSIGSRGLGVELGEVQLYRDVYYTNPPGRRGRWGLSEPVQLGSDEYYVLGDNSSISEDSRTWPEGPAVGAKFLVGKPLVVHFPARHVELGGWHFQVPDLTKIRYIH